MKQMTMSREERLPVCDAHVHVGPGRGRSTPKGDGTAPTETYSLPKRSPMHRIYRL